MNEHETRETYHRRLDQGLAPGRTRVPKEKIRARVKREANTRDLIMFGCSILMMAALALVSQLAVAISGTQSKTGDTE